MSDLGEEEDVKNITQQPEEDVKPKLPKVALTVVNSNGAAIRFMVKRTTPLEKVFTGFEEKMEVAKGTLRYLYCGKRLRPNDTPEGLDMDEEDEIIAELQQVGGSS